MVKVEFSGGLETLFSNVKSMDLDVTGTILDLLNELKPKIKPGQEHFFLQDGLVRPGILVLVNDQDWELLGEEQYELKHDDLILFASTLHGG